MPRLNQVFEVMIPDNIFKYIEEKAAKATQTTTVPTLTTRAEAKKRKAVGALKTISKKKKGAAAKVVDAKEMMESGYGGSATAQAGIEVIETLADVDLGGASIVASLGTQEDGAPSVAVFPTLLSKGSLSSEEFGVAEALASSSRSVELAPSRATRSAKSLRQEESDEESDGQPPSPIPRGQCRAPTSPHLQVGFLVLLTYVSFPFFLFDLVSVLLLLSFS
jgi:hypothetical protein